MRKFIKWAAIVVAAIVVYVLICALVPPMIHKTAESTLTVADIEAVDSPERIRCVDDNVEALVLRLKAINEAQDNIIISTLDLRDDNSGTDIMAALADAAGRGVSVQIMVDGFTAMVHLYFSSTFRALASLPNVEVKFYNTPNPLKMWRINYRLHDKYFICDDIYFLGGRNLHDLFLGDYVDKYNVDRDIMVYGEGSSYSALMERFESVWNGKYVRSMKLRCSGKKAGKVLDALASRWQELCSRYPEITETGGWEDMTFEAASVTLLMTDSAAKTKVPTMWADLVSLMESADDVLLQTPYIIPSRFMYEGLGSVASETESFRIITNSMETGVNFICTGQYPREKNRVLSSGVSITEWVGYQSLHAKAITLNGSISVVGSFNLDMRSAYLNTELMLVINSPELTAQLNSQFESMTEEGRTLYPDGSEVIGEYTQEVRATASKSALMFLCRTVIRPIKFLL